MVADDVGPRREAHAKQPAGGVEGGVDHPVELEIGLDGALVEIVARKPELFGVVAPVPRLETSRCAFGIHEALQRLRVGLGACPAAHPDLFQEGLRRLGRLGHGIGELVVGIGRIAEEAGQLGAQRHDLGNDLAVVVGIAIAPTADERPPDLLAHAAVVRMPQHRLDTRARGGRGIGRIELAVARQLRRCRFRVGWEAVDLGLGQGEDHLVLVAEDVLRELGGEHREALADLGVTRALRIGELRPGANEIQVVAFEHATLLGI